MNKKICNQKYSALKRKRKFKRLKLLIYFIMFQLLFGITTAPIIIYYSPFFMNLRKTIVATAMSTTSHQFIATLFLSDKEIQKIVNGNVIDTSNTISQDLSKINTNNRSDKIELYALNGHKFNGLVAIIHDSTHLKVGYSSKLGTVGQKTSEIAKENNAILAINGGGFSDKGANSTSLWTGNGGIPTGIIISQGKLIYPNKNNLNTSQIYTGIAGITSQGKLVVGNHTVNDLMQLNVKEALCFGPTLIEEGKIIKNLPNLGTDPRTAIGQRTDGTIILLTIDGRQNFQAGAYLEDIQQIMKNEGAFNAVNLDGGASTTMYYNGKVINDPCDKFGERASATAICVIK